MRHFILLSFLLTSYCYSFSQTSVSGNYVTKTNDTINAHIIIPKSIFGSVDLSKLFFKVRVVDSINETKTFKPDDINSFEFNLEEKRYKYYSKPTITKNNLRFLQPVILGQKTNLYMFQTVNQNGAPLGTFYTFENANGEYAFLNTGIRNLNKFKETLNEFYKENLAIQQLINTKFMFKSSLHNDIIEIVKAANKP